MNLQGIDIYNLKLPKMILFDYGHTLVAESGFDTLRGHEAVLSLATSNPDGLTAADVMELTEGFFNGICANVRAAGADTSSQYINNLVYEYLRIGFDVSMEAVELAFWDGAAPGMAMPGILGVLSFLKEHGVRTAVVSNIPYSSRSLRSRVDRLLPGHAFEFFIASSEYIVRKPHPWLFGVALNRAGLRDSPGDAWYCGDSPVADVGGSSAVGMFPVWFDCRELENPFCEGSPPPKLPHLHVNCWAEFLDVVDAIRS